MHRAGDLPSLLNNKWSVRLITLVKDRCLTPIPKALQQGMTPEKLALSLVAGAILGILPIPGSTTLLCSAAAVRLRLNFTVMQAVNYAVYPLQLILMIPFVKMGHCLFPDSSIPLSATELITALQETPWLSIQRLWQVLLGAVAAWLLLCSPLAWASYRLLRSHLSRRTK